MPWRLCTSGAAIRKAGVNANSTIIASGAALADWSDEAESLASSIARVDLSGAWSSLTLVGKQIISDFCSSYIAQKIMIYDPLAYSNREMSIMLNVLENNISKAEKILKEDKNKTYLGIT